MVIERTKLAYYTKDNKRDKKGEILIQTIKDVKPVKEYKNRKFVFGVITTTGRTYYVQGSDEENMHSWINAINLAIGKPGGAGAAAGQGAKSPEVIIPKPIVADTLGPAGSDAGLDKTVALDDFDQLKVIGRGGFGRVLLVRKRDTRKVYAMKILKKAVIAARGEIEHTRTERSVLAKLDHPFLAKLHWSFQTEECLYFVMDFINGGELFHHLSIEKRFSEERARFYVAEIVSGMEYLHKAGVIYRDLKPENLLLNGQGHIVMTDFGLSKEGLHAKDARTATFCGTPEYLAPEIIKGDNYTKAIDWWSVGTLLYEMLTGLPPFYTEDEENMYHKIMTADLVIPPFFSPEVADLIKQFLIRDPAQRLQDPTKIRSHAFFSSISWEKLESLQIVPPFKPEVKSEEDVRNIDDEFLQEDVDAVDEDEEPKGGVRKDEFMGFTFANNEQQNS
jgi:serine/threonine protein kinase